VVAVSGWFAPAQLRALQEAAGTAGIRPLLLMEDAGRANSGTLTLDSGSLKTAQALGFTTCEMLHVLSCHGSHVFDGYLIQMARPDSACVFDVNTPMTHLRVIV
jgi:hypothetical protein